MKCIECNVEFEGKRADARFCSKRCRALYAKHKRNQLSATTAQAQPLSATASIKRNPVQAQPIIATISQAQPAKTEYNLEQQVKPAEIKPKVKAVRLPARPEGISDSQYNYIKMKAGVI